MKALILAAGIGSRLSPLTDNSPKCMVQVNGVSIIEKQINSLLSNRITEIYIVTGFKSELLKSFLRSKYGNLVFIESPDYLNTNNMYSAYLAKDYLCGSEFLMMNADVFFDENVIRRLVTAKNGNLIAVDDRVYYEESMKVVCKEGRVCHIAKTIPETEAYATSIDVYRFSASAGQKFFDICSDYIEKQGKVKLWSEVALDDLLQSEEIEYAFSPCVIEENWVEIDNHEDLRIASGIFVSGKA